MGFTSTNAVLFDVTFPCTFPSSPLAAAASAASTSLVAPFVLGEAESMRSNVCRKQCSSVAVPRRPTPKNGKKEKR